MITAATLARDTRRWLIEAATGLVNRFCPDDVPPAVVAGYHSYERTDSAFLLLYARLAALGVQEIAGRPLSERIFTQLTSLRDAKYATWWCLFIAEALDATAQGQPVERHPLLQRMTEAQRQRVLAASDSSHVVDVTNQKLIGHPNNYWMVMARLELLRRKLGMAISPAFSSCR